MSLNRNIPITTNTINCSKLILIFKFIYKGVNEMYKKAYSSGVERTAHNGLVVGSNPTKPIF